MKKLIVGSLVVIVAVCWFAFSSASPTTAAPTHDLVGRTYEYNYGEDVYQVEFMTVDKLRWTGIAGSEKGQSAEEDYLTLQLDETTFYLAWVEDSGVGVSQIVDLKEGEFLTCLFLKKDVMPLTGTLSQLK